MTYRIKGTDLGPVPTVDIEVKPGLNVLRGANGSGKSTVLDAVQYALTKTGPKPTPRDGTRAGRIEAFGATVTFTSRATAKGNLEVESLSGKLDIGDLIDPGYEDQAVCDKHRIRKLIDLSGAEATAEMFAPLVGNAGSDIPTDLIDAADWAKRRLQQQALDAERQAESLRAKATAAREALAGVDLNAECDEEALRERYVDAATDLASLRERKQQVDAQRKAAEDARGELDKHKTQLSLEDAQEALETAKRNGEEARERATSASQESAVSYDALIQATTTCREANEAADNQREAVEKTTADVQRLEREIAVARAELKTQKEGLSRCDKRVKEAYETHHAASNRWQAASSAKNQAEAALHCAVTDYRAAESQLQAALEWQQQHDAWQASIDAVSGLEPIDDLAIEVRRTECERSRKAMEQGAVVRKAKQQAAAAEDFDAAAIETAKEAEDLRRRAAATDDILAAELQRIGCPWRPVDVPKGNGTERRLVCRHKRGDATLVSELSEGERAKHAIDVALKLAGKSDKPAVLILRQELFEGLQPAVRQEINEHARERNVVILTASASDDKEVTL